MLIHLPFPLSVINSVLHLLKRGMERRGKKLLRPGAVAAVSDVEGVLTVAVALPEIGNARPSDDDGAGVGVRGRERERSYCGPEDKIKNKWAP